MSDEADEIVPIFALKIQELTSKTGLTQAELARRCGMGRDTFNRYYSGRTQPPPRRLVALARLFGVDPLDIDPSASEKDIEEASKETVATMMTSYRMEPPASGRPSDIRLVVDCDVPLETAFRIVEMINAQRNSDAEK